MVRDFEKNVGVARPVQWAVAGEVPPPQFSSDVIDADTETSGQQVLSISPYRFLATERQRMWVAPLRGSGNDYDVRRQSTALTTGALKSLGHLSPPNPIASCVSDPTCRPGRDRRRR